MSRLSREPVRRAQKAFAFSMLGGVLLLWLLGRGTFGPTAMRLAFMAWPPLLVAVLVQSGNKAFWNPPDPRPAEGAGLLRVGGDDGSMRAPGPAIALSRWLLAWFWRPSGLYTLGALFLFIALYATEWGWGMRAGFFVRTAFPAQVTAMVAYAAALAAFLLRWPLTKAPPRRRAV